ncbi:MAG: FAD-dependent thymidylate synthase, partial [Oxalobacteraceae bacterium]
SDADIVSAARVSYGDGTKTVSEDRGLIRYLVSHRHTSPIEMAEVKLHLKMPIFIMRQWVRHRTASLNEYSGRYSVMSDEFYRPTGDALKPQSEINKQGGEGSFTEREQDGIEWMMDAAYDHAYSTYQGLITPGVTLTEAERRDSLYDLYNPDPEWGYFDESFCGVSRELGRLVLPVANYTELYWKQDLHNLLHLIKLRRDTHAQAEIREYAEAVYTLIKPLFPLTIEAWEDYIWEGVHLSRMDAELLQTLLESNSGSLDMLIELAGGNKAFADTRGYSLRELKAFRARWKV